MSINVRQLIFCFLFFVVFFIITRQVPFSEYSLIANIAVIILVIGMVEYSRNNIIAISLILIWLCILFQYSIFKGNDVNKVLNFSFVIFLLMICNLVKNIPKQIVNIFYILISVQCIFLIIMEFILNVFYTQNSYLLLREYFLEKGWGDLYTYNGYFYRVQVKGNALIPIAFCLTFIKEVKDCIKYYNFYRILTILGVIIAGNLAFWISTILFILGYFIFFGKSKFNKIIVVSSLIAMSSSVFLYISEAILRKEDSLGTRGDQFEVLISGLIENVYTFTFGSGLGSTLSVVTSFRNYTDRIYYELQAIYFVFQLGILNSIIFFGLMLYFAIKKIYYKDLLFLYIIYLSYAMTNPYFLDTNHLVFILTLRLIYEIRKENRLYNSII